MSDRCCPSPHLTLERRRSDFEADGRITPFTGSCCSCCCCLHWIAAAAGGIVGLRMGWTSAEQKSSTPTHPVVRKTLNAGAGIGVVTTVVLTIALSAAFGGGPLFVLALLPSLVFLPVGATMILSAYGLKWRMIAAFRRETKKLPPAEGTSTSLYRRKQQAALKTRDELLDFHVFCRHCWHELDESMHLPACPECGQAITRPVLSGPDYGTSIAWRAAFTSFGMSTVATVGAYVFMYLLLLVLK